MIRAWDGVAVAARDDVGRGSTTPETHILQLGGSGRVSQHRVLSGQLLNDLRLGRDERDSLLGSVGALIVVVDLPNPSQ